jgi:hypothetical protein
MEDRICEHNNNLVDVKESLLELTKICTTKELSCIFNNIENVLHLTTKEMHN